MCYLECGADIGCNLFEFLGSEFEFGIAEKHVFLTLHGDKVNVGVGHLKTQNGLSYLDAVKHLLLGNGNLLGKKLKVTQFLVSQVKQIVNLTLGDAQNVTLYQRVDVQKCKAVLCLGYLIAGNLTCYYP